MNASVEWLNAFLDAPRTARELRDLLAPEPLEVTVIMQRDHGG